MKLKIKPIISVMELIRAEIVLLENDIESLEILKNEAIFKEIANLDIHVKMDKERIKELIKILKEKIGEIDRQYKKFCNREVKEELDYWQERAKCELIFLYVLGKKYEEATALIKEILERGRPLHEAPFSNLRLVKIFFRRGETFLEDYERSELWERERLTRNMSPSARDKNIKWSLRAAFAFGKCLNKLWKENKQNFIDNEEITKKIAREDSRLLIGLMRKIKNIERKIA